MKTVNMSKEIRPRQVERDDPRNERFMDDAVVAPVLAGDARKRCRLLKVLDERIHIAEILAQHVLLLFLRPSVLPRRTPAIVASRSTTAPLKSVGELTRTPLRTSNRDLGHQVEVQELQQLDLDVLSSLLVLEQARHRQQSVHVLEYARVLWCCEECCDEYKEGLRLDGGAVVGVEKVEEEVHVDFATEDDARRWV
jgi:hypothetical protein